MAGAPLLRSSGSEDNIKMAGSALYSKPQLTLGQLSCGKTQSIFMVTAHRVQTLVAAADHLLLLTGARNNNFYYDRR